jgi:hypothetical protein
LAAFDLYTQSDNKILRAAKKDRKYVPTLETSMLYMSLHQTIISSTKRIVTVALTPYPLVAALDDIIEAVLKTRKQQHRIDVPESRSSAAFSFQPSFFTSSVILANFVSSRAKLLEQYGHRENFFEFYSNSAAGKSSASYNNSRKQFCDFAFMDILSTVSVKMIALIMMELCRNRWELFTLLCTCP